MDAQARQVQAIGKLLCLECGMESRLARGWRAYFDEEACLLVYCPQCAAREFDT